MNINCHYSLYYKLCQSCQNGSSFVNFQKEEHLKQLYAKTVSQILCSGRIFDLSVVFIQHYYYTIIITIFRYEVRNLF